MEQSAEQFGKRAVEIPGVQCDFMAETEAIPAVLVGPERTDSGAVDLSSRGRHHRVELSDALLGK